MGLFSGGRGEVQGAGRCWGWYLWVNSNRAWSARPCKVQICLNWENYFSEFIVAFDMLFICSCQKLNFKKKCFSSVLGCKNTKIWQRKTCQHNFHHVSNPYFATSAHYMRQARIQSSWGSRNSVTEGNNWLKGQEMASKIFLWPLSFMNFINGMPVEHIAACV